MKETVVDVHLQFVMTETGMFPVLEGKCNITCVGADGKEWKGKIVYNDGRDPADTIRTICKMESFRATIPQLAQVAADASPEETKPSGPDPYEPYKDIRSDLAKKKMGELRKIISDQNLDLTTGGKKKAIVIDEIISCLKYRDGVTEETPNEEA